MPHEAASEGLNANRLFTLRYVDGAEHEQLVRAAIEEYERFNRSGRLPLAVIWEALHELIERTEDKLFEDCPSWAESIYARWFPGFPMGTSQRVTRWKNKRSSST